MSWLEFRDNVKRDLERTKRYIINARKNQIVAIPATIQTQEDYFRDLKEFLSTQNGKIVFKSGGPYETEEVFFVKF